MIYPGDFKLKSSWAHQKKEGGGRKKLDKIEEEKVAGNKREAEELKTATV